MHFLIYGFLTLLCLPVHLICMEAAIENDSLLRDQAKQERFVNAFYDGYVYVPDDIGEWPNIIKKACGNYKYAHALISSVSFDFVTHSDVVESVKSRAEEGIADYQFVYGLCLIKKAAKELNNEYIEHARQFYEKSCDQKCPQGYYALGKLHETLAATFPAIAKENLDIARELYQKGMDANSLPATRRMVHLYRDKSGAWFGGIIKIMDEQIEVLVAMFKKKNPDLIQYMKDVDQQVALDIGKKFKNGKEFAEQAQMLVNMLNKSQASSSAPKRLEKNLQPKSYSLQDLGNLMGINQVITMEDASVIADSLRSIERSADSMLHGDRLLEIYKWFSNQCEHVSVTVSRGVETTKNDKKLKKNQLEKCRKIKDEIKSSMSGLQKKQEVLLKAQKDEERRKKKKEQHEQKKAAKKEIPRVEEAAKNSVEEVVELPALKPVTVTETVKTNQETAFSDSVSWQSAESPRLKSEGPKKPKLKKRPSALFDTEKNSHDSKDRKNGSTNEKRAHLLRTLSYSVLELNKPAADKEKIEEEPLSSSSRGVPLIRTMSQSALNVTGINPFKRLSRRLSRSDLKSVSDLKLTETDITKTLETLKEDGKIEYERNGNTIRATKKNDNTVVLIIHAHGEWYKNSDIKQDFLEFVYRIDPVMWDTYCSSAQ